jgi:hypothetical protein
MATFTTTANLPRSFIRKAEILPQLEGSEGKKLSQKIDNVTKTLNKDEPIKRLLQQFEEGNQERNQKLQLYLDSLRFEAKSTSESEFSIATLDSAWQIWIKLKNYFLSKGLCLEVPDACPGYKDNFMYTWSKAQHYLECEIFGTQEVEFFYRNRNNGEVWGEDTTIEQEFSPTILDKAALFVW